MLQDSAKRLYENSSDSEKELWHQIILQVMDVFASELFKRFRSPEKRWKSMG